MTLFLAVSSKNRETAFPMKSRPYGKKLVPAFLLKIQVSEYFNILQVAPLIVW